MSHESVRSAAQSGISELVGVPIHRVLILGAKVMPTRRLQETTEEYYILDIEYALVVDSAELGAGALENAIESLNTTQLAASINADLARSKRSHVKIGVEGIAAPVSVNYLPSATVTSTSTPSTTVTSTSTHRGALPPLAGPAIGHTSITIAIVVSVFVFATLVGVCYFGCRGRREQNSKLAMDNVDWFLDLEEPKSMSISQSTSTALDAYSMRVGALKMCRVLVV
jgi:hypothetical protein